MKLNKTEQMILDEAKMPRLSNSKVYRFYTVHEICKRRGVFNKRVFNAACSLRSKGLGTLQLEESSVEYSNGCPTHTLYYAFYPNA